MWRAYKMKSLIFALAFLLQTSAWADELPLYQIVIKDNKFIPDTVKVKVDEKFRLEVKNEDSGSEEFESATLHIEKILGPKKTLRLVLGPLKKGTYSFMGEFHQATAQGKIIAE